MNSVFVIRTCSLLLFAQKKRLVTGIGGATAKATGAKWRGVAAHGRQRLRCRLVRSTERVRAHRLHRAQGHDPLQSDPLYDCDRLVTGLRAAQGYLSRRGKEEIERPNTVGH